MIRTMMLLVLLAEILILITQPVCMTNFMSSSNCVVVLH